jgi:hypothetical protein
MSVAAVDPAALSAFAASRRTGRDARRRCRFSVGRCDDWKVTIMLAFIPDAMACWLIAIVAFTALVVLAVQFFEESSFHGDSFAGRNLDEEPSGSDEAKPPEDAEAATRADSLRPKESGESPVEETSTSQRRG